MSVYVPPNRKFSETIAERLLKLTAVRVELPPSQHRLACERKAAIERHLERDESPLAGRITIFYQQGSMAIGATIRAKRREDGYDIDIVVEVDLPYSIGANDLLDLLYRAVRGERGSRYYDCTARQTRCVTIYYADGMHIDLSPTRLVQPLNPRKSVLPHAKPERPRHEDKFVPTNSYGFAAEFNERNPVDMLFEDSYAELAARNDRGMVFAEAESEDVPDHSSKVGGKSTTVVALQLIKRFTYLRYGKRSKLRMPPSVMSSCLILEAARPQRSLSEALLESVDYMLRQLEAAQRGDRLIDVRNPTDPEDCFTDRWPETLDEQEVFIEDLRYFKRELVRLLNPNASLAERGEIIKDLFGETPGREAINEVARELGQAAPPQRKSVVAPALVGTGVTLAPRIASAKPTPTPPSTFYGLPWPK